VFGVQFNRLFSMTRGVNAQAIVGLALKASIMLTLFGFELQTSREELIFLWRRPRLLARSLIAM
jgi:bile acid:Na+ symporter, BASS family